VLQAFKHFNMVDVNIAFLNKDSFKGASTNRQLFQQTLCASITYLLKIYLNLGFNGFKVYNMGFK
jgi:hypothetical protein